MYFLLTGEKTGRRRKEYHISCRSMVSTSYKSCTREKRKWKAYRLSFFLCSQVVRIAYHEHQTYRS